MPLEEDIALHAMPRAAKIAGGVLLPAVKNAYCGLVEETPTLIVRTEAYGPMVRVIVDPRLIKPKRNLLVGAYS